MLVRMYELKVYNKNGVIGFVIILKIVKRGNFNV